MARGDHIYVCRDTYKGVSFGRTLYTHHAVDMGDETVIEYVSSTSAKRDSVVTRRAFGEFASGGRVRVKEYAVRLAPEETAARAESWLGNGGYDFFTNNCEHFASWCVTGDKSSAQIESGVASAGLVGTTALAPSVGVEVVGTLGSAAVRSGPNVMSGLCAVGGSAVGGITVLSGASGLAASGIMCYALRDKPMLPEPEGTHAGPADRAQSAERPSEQSVRCAWSELLGVPGYSAAGISSGLATIGRVTGGGMVRGLSSTMLIPALFALIVGYLLYRHASRREPEVRAALGSAT